MPKRSPAPAPSPRGSAKLQRWTDLLAALLVRNFPATFRDLAQDVAAYRDAGKSEGALMRMFERDKDELRAFGVPIETVVDEEGSPSAYRLSRKDFYLPYLCVAAPGGRSASRARRVDAWGYHALTTLAFEPDELQAVADAAARVRALGDPLLGAETDSAMRKLALDLPMDAAVDPRPDVTLVPPRARPEAAAFEALSDALARRKVATFEYRAMTSGETARREVEPYGLFFLSGHWYLAARDRAHGGLRNFRLSRIAGAAVNGQRPQTADYEIPAEFRLREHARSRHPWELGDGDAVEAIVEFRGESGAATAAAELGAPVEGDGSRRLFQVRRPDAFARWLLSFAGEAVPVAPAGIVEAYREQVRRTWEVYGGERGGRVRCVMRDA